MIKKLAFFLVAAGIIFNSFSLMCSNDNKIAAQKSFFDNIAKLKDPSKQAEAIMGSQNVIPGTIALLGAVGLFSLGAKAVYDKECTMTTGSLLCGAFMLVFFGLIFKDLDRKKRQELMTQFLSNK